MVHSLLSLQGIGKFMQPLAGSHWSIVQALLSLQLIAVWVIVPVAGSHASVVQASLSVVLTGV
jgi:hypothetical protein